MEKSNEENRMADETLCDGIDLNFVDDSEEDSDDDWIRSAPVKYFTNEVSYRGRLRRIFLRNPSTRLRLRIFDLVAKSLLCILYFVRVLLDDQTDYECNGHHCESSNGSLPQDDGSMVFSSTAINWYVILWVQRPMVLWIIQVVISMATMSKVILELIIGSKGICYEKVFHDGLILEIICTVPMIATVVYPPLLMNLFVPGFLNIWLIKWSLVKLFNDLPLTKQRFQTISVTLFQQLLIVIMTLFCLVFTTICGIQHIQRGSDEKNRLTMFESFYFVIVTFSTVGYGDISPDSWLGQLFMALMICLAFAFIPRQLEGIHSTWKERKKTGGEYSSRQARGHKHVVVVSSSLTADDVMDFLIEFYAHSKLEDHIVVLLSSEEKDTNLQVILKDPKWAHRVIYMKGSALKDVDLRRCRLNEADACFILAPSLCDNKDEADQHTVLRSWAVKDFAPLCRQYVQLNKTEYKLHVKFAEHVVCEDEFKYALFANNCLYPGLSTLVTMLLHTTSRDIGKIAQEPWQKVYGMHAGNEVYHIQLKKSVFFRSYEKKKFTEASCDAHRRFGVCLVAVLDINADEPRLQLNPGSEYVLKATDYCFYIGEFKEEYSQVKSTPAKSIKSAVPSGKTKNIEDISDALEKLLQHDIENNEYGDESLFNQTITSQVGQEIARRVRSKSLCRTMSNGSDSSPTETEESEPIEPKVYTHMGSRKSSLVPSVLREYTDMGQEQIITGPPPVTLYSSSKRTVCYLMKKQRPSCCLKWGEDCAHCTYKNARDDRWRDQLIILTTEQASAGIYNFIVPLRSHFIGKHSLSPIILLLEEKPEDMFLDTIGHFPLVYWMQGKITNIDDLILAGINKVSHLVIANRETCGEALGDSMVDSETIVAVQTILKLFPNTSIITELRQTTNIRFMQFQANNEYTRKVSKMERRLNASMSSSLAHLFRLPFAAGQVFSASMLNSLLYQTLVKGYLISFVRLLLGIDAQENSGHLSSVRIKRMTLARYPTYGELYNGMASTTGEIPIAIYRTEPKETAFSPPDLKENTNKKSNSKSSRGKRYSRGAPFPKAAFQNEANDNSGLGDLVRNRLRNLGMKESDYTEIDEAVDLISYVILNPTPKRRLRVGDIVYVIQPSSMAAIPSKHGWNMVKAMFTKQPLSRQRSDPSRRSTSPHINVGDLHYKTVGAKVNTRDLNALTELLSSRRNSSAETMTTNDLNGNKSDDIFAQRKFSRPKNSSNGLGLPFDLRESDSEKDEFLENQKDQPMEQIRNLPKNQSSSSLKGQSRFRVDPSPHISM